MITNIFKILGYIATALAIFIAGWQLSDWYKGEIIQVRTTTVHDTLFISSELPKEIEKTIYVGKIERVRDTIFKEVVREKYVEFTTHDTVYVERSQERMVLDYLIRDTNNIRIMYKDILLPQIKDNKEREWWQDLIYFGITAGLTYGIANIK